jgi:hypothetical protein
MDSLVNFGKSIFKKKGGSEPSGSQSTSIFGKFGKFIVYS